LDDLLQAVESLLVEGYLLEEGWAYLASVVELGLQLLQADRGYLGRVEMFALAVLVAEYAVEGVFSAFVAQTNELAGFAMLAHWAQIQLPLVDLGTLVDLVTFSGSSCLLLSRAC